MYAFSLLTLDDLLFTLPRPKQAEDEDGGEIEEQDDAPADADEDAISQAVVNY